jgi:hypothetical protein
MNMSMQHALLKNVNGFSGGKEEDYRSKLRCHKIENLLTSSHLTLVPQLLRNNDSSDEEENASVRKLQYKYVGYIAWF